MKKVYKIFRALAVALLVIAVGLPPVLYVLFSLDSVQNGLRQRAETELSRLLDTPVSIGAVSLQFPSRLVLSDVAVKDKAGVDALTVSRIDAAVEMRALLETQRIIVTYAEIDRLNANIYRASDSAPLNIDHIIKALQPKDKTKPPTMFDLRIGHLLVRQSSASYNVLSAPQPREGQFDPRHVKVKDINMNVLLPRLKNDCFAVNLRRMSATERSGLRLSNLQFEAEISSKGINVNGLSVRTPRSAILLGDIDLAYNGWNDIIPAIKHSYHHLSLLEGTVVTPAEFAPVLPVLSSLDNEVEIVADIDGALDKDIEIETLSLRVPDINFSLDIAESLVGGMDKGDLAKNIQVDLGRVYLSGDVSKILSKVTSFTRIPEKTMNMLGRLGNVSVEGKAVYSDYTANARLTVSTSLGEVFAEGKTSFRPGSPATFNGDYNLNQIDIAGILGDARLPGQVSMDGTANLKFGKPYPSGSLIAEVSRIVYKGYSYSGINLAATSEDEKVTVALDVNDPHATLNLDGQISTAFLNSTQFSLEVGNIDFSALNLSPALNSHRLSFTAEASLAGHDINSIDGWLKLNNIAYINDNAKGVNLDAVFVESSCSGRDKSIFITSDIFDGKINGSFNLSTIGSTAKDIVAHFIPALVGEPSDLASRHQANLDNDFTFDFTIKDNRNLERMVNLPVTLLSPVKVSGMMSYPMYTMQLDIDAPYLAQKNKIITGSSLNINLDGLSSSSQVSLKTEIPTKRGTLALNVEGAAVDNRINTQIDWVIPNKNTFSGDLNFTTTLSRESGADGKSYLDTKVNVNPGTAIFNDTIWDVIPSSIDIKPGLIRFNKFMARHEQQLISIDGVAAADTTSMLKLSLRDIDLDYIFSTLDIPNVMFGGYATGDFYASGLLASDPRLYTPLLDVKGLSYNGCVMGDGTILSQWLADERAITIDADILQADNRHSRIDGRIKPLDEELDFYFDANHAPIGFLQPFMAAFCSDIQGHASGKAHLYGTFKLIDMTGDLMADDIRMKLDFTNVYYTASDSVHIRPGRIDLDNIRLTDPYGKHAMLNGYLTHECFKKPVFEFKVSDVKDMLVYDVPENDEQRWYGRVFGNGNASVTGHPGLVNIEVNMTTASKSTFTFVLSDAEIANEYTFLTFRDRDHKAKDTTATVSREQANVEQMKKLIERQKQIDVPSTYIMKINVNVTPQAAVNLIMDPIGGDAIKAYGSGAMSMTYDSSSEDLKMRGTYTLTRGNYNFTLQDIIIKDFTIEPGSSITFNGDPYAAQLDITAAYSLNANLTDLDESFAHDKELNRTNVPVHALLIARGDMRHPEISFDLAFPTLTQDTYRKVRSIVSTDEMMNTQIIYLLALNRFYTPEYMSSTTKGNELVSVASSTLSSQLSSILGNLSDNWSIAPNVRSDRGDFSDVEVDVALSSHLLNNRLLLNGNFGYRDKSLNSNSFIGDFDAEYLLNRAGTIRLKAYNRYNDQNYYVKNALTTQGVGVVFKRDFDNIFSFLRPLRRRFAKESKDSLTAKPDSITNDSVVSP